MNEKVTVTLRKRERGGGKTYLYLSYYPPVVNPMTLATCSQESLRKYVYTSPKNETERRYNKRIMQIAESVRCERAVKIACNEYSFFDRSLLTESFISYFERFAKKKGGNRTGSFAHFSQFCGGTMTFGNLTNKVCEKFKEYLLNEAVDKRSGKHICTNTACDYFRIFRAAVNSAIRDGYLTTSPLIGIKSIREIPTERPFLTKQEIASLMKTPCKYDVLRRASFFAILTGLRISDIMTLNWEDITVAPDGGPCLIKEIQKVSRREMIFISDEALSYCGTRYEKGPVFPGLEPFMVHYPLKRWLEDAGIDKKFSFHCFRHTYATLQIAGGTDIYTLSRQLTHRFVATTQIYAKLVDEKRRASAEAITLEGL